MSAKYLSVFLKKITPITSKIETAMRDIPRSSQLTGAFPKREALAAFITPVIGFSANIQEYAPAILAG